MSDARVLAPNVELAKLMGLRLQPFNEWWEEKDCWFSVDDDKWIRRDPPSIYPHGLYRDTWARIGLEKDTDFIVLMGDDPGCTFSKLPAYDTDLNAMREVWKFLKVRGLFDRFWKTYWGMSVKPFHVENLGACFYHMNNDLPGQVKAAIKVLKEAQG